MVIVVDANPPSEINNSVMEQMQPQPPLARGPAQGLPYGTQDGFGQKDGGPRPVRQNMFRTEVSL